MGERQRGRRPEPAGKEDGLAARVPLGRAAVHLLVHAVQPAQGPGFRVQGAGFRVQGSGFRVQGSGCRVQGAGFRVQGPGFRVQGSGFRVQGATSRNSRTVA